MDAVTCKKLRRAAGFSRKELGILLGVDEEHAERIVSDMEDVTNESHVHACKYFNFGVWAILNGSEECRKIVNDYTKSTLHGNN